MRGQWNLREWEVDFWTSFFKKKIAELEAGYITKVDLTNEDLCPENVIDVLLAMGYQDDNVDTNGWEQDTWIYFFHEETNKGLTLFYCGRTFEMNLYLSIEED